MSGIPVNSRYRANSIKNKAREGTRISCRNLKRHALCDQRMRQSDAKDMLATLLALDRMLVEVSMRVYNVSEADKLLMRKQNRRLHHLFRQHYPRLRQAVFSLSQIPPYISLVEERWSLSPAPTRLKEEPMDYTAQDSIYTSTKPHEPASSSHGGEEMECCSSVSGYHRPDCPEYDRQMRETLDRLQSLLKRSPLRSETRELKPASLRQRIGALLRQAFGR